MKTRNDSLIEYIHSLESSTKDQPFVTIITAFFHFEKSKHSIDEYKSWLPNLFTAVTQPMVIFTSAELAPTLKSFRKPDMLTCVVTEYSSPWEMPPILRLEEILRRQIELDPEKFRHSPDLYAVWAAKPWLVNLTTFWNPFRTKYFMWIDAGAFRHRSYRFYQWPNPARLLESLVDKKNDVEKLLLGLVKPLPIRFCQRLSKSYGTENGPIEEDLIQGTMFAGCAESLRWWANIYFETLDIFIRAGYFVGKDQSVMNTIALSQANQIRVFTLFKVNCGDPWFAFGPLLADSNDNASAMHTCFPKTLHGFIYSLNQICSDAMNTIS